MISRSGASTVSEIAVIGRSAILVPYPYALDHDQAANAQALMHVTADHMEGVDALLEKRVPKFTGE